MDWKQFMKDQFHYSKLSLSHGDWRIFVYTPWLPRNWFQLIYMAYRWMICLYFLVWLAYAGYQSTINHDPGKWLIFITAWEFLLLNAYLLMAAIVVTHKLVLEQYVKHRVPEPLQVSDLQDVPFVRCYCCCRRFSVPSPRPLLSGPQHQFQACSIPWYIQVVWLLYVLTSHLCFPVIIVYWSLGFDVMNLQVTLHEHLFIAVPVVIDMIVTGYPFRFYHFVYSSMLAVVYFIFSLLYYAAGGTNSDGDRFIYSILDYGGSLGTALFVVLLLTIFVPVVVNSLFWAVYLLRTFLIYKKLGANVSNESVLYSPRVSADTFDLVETENSITTEADGTIISTVMLDIQQ